MKVQGDLTGLQLHFVDSDRTRIKESMRTPLLLLGQHALGSAVGSRAGTGY